MIGILAVDCTDLYR